MHPVHRSGVLLLVLALTVATSASAQDDAALERARQDPPLGPADRRAQRSALGDSELQDRSARRRRVRLRTPSTPGHTDFARLKAGQVGAQFWSIYVPGEVKDSGYARIQLEEFDIARRIIARYPDRLALRSTAADIEREFKRGRIGSLLGMEGGHVIENSLGALRAYYDLGARYLTLTHNVTLDWADAANGHRQARRTHRVRPRGGAGDEPAGDAGRSLARLSGHDERRARRGPGPGDLLPLVRARPDRPHAQRARLDPRAGCRRTAAW